jgi:hypothetical protein
MNPHRPTTVPIASVLLSLLTLFALITPLTPNGPPAPISYISLGVGVGGLPAVVGWWKMQPWGGLLTSMLAVLALLPALSGLIFAPLVGHVVSALLLVCYALGLVLVMLPATRKAVTAAPTPVARG